MLISKDETDTIICFILHSVSHKGAFEADIIFARHSYSRSAEAGQPTGQPPRLVINRGGHYKITATVNELLTVAGIVR